MSEEVYKQISDKITRQPPPTSELCSRAHGLSCDSGVGTQAWPSETITDTDNRGYAAPKTDRNLNVS